MQEQAQHEASRRGMPVPVSSVAAPPPPPLPVLAQPANTGSLWLRAAAAIYGLLRCKHRPPPAAAAIPPANR